MNISGTMRLSSDDWLLFALSAFLCGTAFYVGHPTASGTFAALACGTAVAAVTRRRLL